MFFDYFPKFLYNLQSNTVTNDGFITVTDIFRRVAPQDKFIVNETYLETYTIKAGERPEDIAYDLYGDPEYHWVLLIINNIIDPYNEWYYSPEQLYALVEQRYTKPNDTHHFALVSNPLICSDYDEALIASGELVEVTHLEHEELENDARQEIKVLHPRYLKDFVSEFKRKIGN